MLKFKTYNASALPDGENEKGTWFNSIKYLTGRTDCGSLRIFQAEDKDKIIGRSAFFIQETTAFSPCKAPYGGFEISDDTIIHTFIRFCLNSLSSEGLKKIMINNWPEAYFPDMAIETEYALFQNGFKTTKALNNAHLVIKEDFHSRLHHSERRRLEKCRRAGFHAEALKTPLPKEEVDKTFALLMKHRTQRGFPLSLSRSGLDKLLMEESSCTLFRVKDQNHHIAAALGIHVNKEILYYFFPGSDPEYNHFSPTVMLIEKMHQYCRSQGYTLLDLGISSRSEGGNPGLERFKKNLGARTSLKKEYTLTYGS